MRIFTLILTVLCCGPAITGGAISWTEDFESFTELPITGWLFDNQSDNPLEDWQAGSEFDFNAHAGGIDSYVGSSGNAINGGNTVCNWLFMPDLGFIGTLSFYTRKNIDNPERGGGNDIGRMVVAHSPTGTEEPIPCQEVIRGGKDYQVLLDINANQTPGNYPTTWTQYSIEVNATGRIAFVHWVNNVADAGISVATVGLDTVAVSNGSPPQSGVNPVPLFDAWGIGLMLTLLVLIAYLKMQRRT